MDDYSFSGNRLIHTVVLSLLFLVLISPGAANSQCIRLNPDLELGENVQSFQISEDGRAAVYIADQEMDGINELYSVDISSDEQTPVKISGDLMEGENVEFFNISPDGTRVVYMADQDMDNVFELYSVPIGGGDITKLNSPLGANSDVTPLFQISSGGRVVYTVERGDGAFELYSVPIVPAAGEEAVIINIPFAEGGFVLPSDFQITPDGSRVVYRIAQDPSSGIDLYSVPIGGGEAVRLNDLIAGGGSVSFFRISPGGRVILQTRESGSDMDVFYSIPAEGGEAVRVFREPDGVDIITLEVSSGGRVVYLADRISSFEFELFSVPVDGGGTVKLNMDGQKLNSFGINFGINQDGDRVVYTTDTNELFSVSILGSGEAVNLGQNVGSFQISAVNNIVVYTNIEETQLNSVPILGGESTLLNQPPLVENGEITSFEITPNGSRVVYRADQSIDGVFELFSCVGDDDTAPPSPGDDDDDTPTPEEDDGGSGCNTIVGKSPTTMDFAGALLPFMFIPLAVYYRRRKRA